jgi:hypothetical protein
MSIRHMRHLITNKELITDHVSEVVCLRLSINRMKGYWIILINLISTWNLGCVTPEKTGMPEDRETLKGLKKQIYNHFLKVQVVS